MARLLFHCSPIKIMLTFLYYVALWIGYCWWPVAFCNRILSLPVREDRLSLIRIAVHDLPMLAGPFLIYYVWHSQSFSTPGPDQPWTFSDVLTCACWLGWGGILRAGLTTHWNQHRSRKRSHEEILSRIDRQAAPCFPVNGWHPRAIVARLPGNQSRTCIFNRKHLDLFHLPSQLDGLSILHFSDVHFLGDIPLAYFEAVFDRISQSTYDLAIFSGDLVDNPQLADWLPSTFAKVQTRYGRFAILGNHDWNFADTQVLRRQIRDCDWTVLEDQPIFLNIEGARLALYGTEAPWMVSLPDTLPNFHAADVRLLVSHTPDNIGWAKRQQVDLMLSGHNHGGQIRIPCYGPIYSPSRYGIRYASGIIDEHPTLLHVSRGLSARIAIRYNCPPEVTELVLRVTDQQQKS